MLGSAIPAASATPPSSTRSGRLRGLSYLRNYTRDHLPGVSRDETPPQLEPSLSASSSATANTSRQRTLSPTQQQEESLQRREAERAAASLRRDSETVLSTPHAGGVADSARGEAYTSASASTITTRAISGRTEADAATEGSLQASRGDSMTEEQPEGGASGSANASLPAIRLIPHAEARSSRPSLHFTAVSRTLKHAHNVVRVGRYSERDMNGISPNGGVSPVGFKSKVVSRRHCEFWCTNGQWYVKDVKSSSGTFLNHVRLSSPGVESRPYPVNDGDVVQLGIDFKGGEEVIFRCVKIRIECNRGWQKSLNSFNTTAHQRLLKPRKVRDSDATSINSSDCSICLNPVAPCQALFVAPCSHVWHYKCIRNLIQGPNWPNFLCPNCRYVADLEADVEPEEGPDLSSFDEVDEKAGADMRDENGDMENDSADVDAENLRQLYAEQRLQETDGDPGNDDDPGEMPSSSVPGSTNDNVESESSRSRTRPVDINTNKPATAEMHAPRSATPTSNAQFALAAGVTEMPNTATEGPTTPRNTTGPFVFDGLDREPEE